MNKILVVDDDLDILTLVKLALTMNEFTVDAISRWEEIDNKLKDFVPDLVLLDVSLNGADGRDICKKIKDAENTRHIPVVLFSANANMEAFVPQCHAEASIAKPFELSNLIHVIKSNLPASIK